MVVWTCFSGTGSVLLEEHRADEWWNDGEIKQDKMSDVEQGYRYQYGIGVPRDVRKALNCYRRDGSGESFFLMALCLYEGKDIPPDPKGVEAFLYMAAASGLPHALIVQAVMLLRQEDVPGNRQRAIALLEEASRRASMPVAPSAWNPFFCGEFTRITEAMLRDRLSHTQDPVIQYLLGTFYMKGAYVSWDREESVRWYEKAAMQGYARAQRNLGRCYLFGKGVEADRAAAVYWYRKAAEQLDAARLDLAIILLHETKTDSEMQEAFQLLQARAERGDSNAAFVLGCLYADGRGVERNMKTAAKWFLAATKLGPGDAQIAMAYIRFTGDGLPVDRSEALRWMEYVGSDSGEYLLPFECAAMPEMAVRAMQELSKEAERGDVAAQSALGDAYYNGVGPMRDVRKSMEWFLAAADQGNERALVMLNCFRHIAGDVSDARNELRKKYLKAAEAGDARAIRHLQMLEPQWGWRSDN